jgi:hypothetical protein
MSWFKKKKLQPSTHEYGRYLHRPVCGRALAMVTGMNCVTLMQTGDLTLNGLRVSADQRLEAGDYKVYVASLQKTWTFFIR